MMEENQNLYMGENQGIYTERFRTEIVPGVSVEYLLEALKDSYPESLGWNLGEHSIEIGMDGKRYLVVPLTKYPVNDNRRIR